MVAALHEYILEEVGNLLATEVLHKLLVAGMVIETETCIVGKNAEPISIVLLIYTCLLQENLLHLLQVSSIYLLLYLFYTLEEIGDGGISLLRIQAGIGGDADDGCLVVEIAEHAEGGSCMVSCTQLLTDGAQILHLQQSGGYICQYHILHREWQLGAPYL